MRTRTAPLPRRFALAAAAALLAGCAGDRATAPTADADAPALARAAADGAGQSALAAVRAATARYHRVEVAEADGYASTIECVSSPAGGMGVHYVNADLLGAPAPTGDAILDPTRPEVLVYEPQPNGKMRLVAVEYLVWRASWDARHPGTGPSLFGQPFVRSFFPEAHGLPDHYELHVWLWQQNPSGMFAQWNPKVTCPTGA